MFDKTSFSAHRFAITLSLWLAVSPVASFSQEPYAVIDHYNKHEHMIPMRDGIKLFTAVYTPKDTTQDYPILMTRTPYGCRPYGENEYPPFVGAQAERFFREGYIIVSQDVRGRYMSEGVYVNVRPYIEKKSSKDVDESSDTYDTVFDRRRALVLRHRDRDFAAGKEARGFTRKGRQIWFGQGMRETVVFSEIER